MTWRHTLVKTLTGEPLFELTPALVESWEGSRLANSAGSGSLSLQLRTARARDRLSADLARAITQPWYATYVLSWDDTALYAGLIDSRAWDPGTGVLAMTTAELRVMASKRGAFGVGGFDSGTFGIYDLSYRSALYVVIQKIFSGGSERWNLPLIYPWVESGPVRRTYWNYEFWTGEDMLHDLQNTEGGSDLDFRPVWMANGWLKWEVRLGVPRLQAPTYSWNLGARRSGITEFSLVEDAKRQLTGVYAVGKGSELDIAWGSAGSGDIGGGPEYLGPWLDAQVAMKSVDDHPQLNAAARAYLRTRRYPTEQFSMTVQADQYPGAGALLPGSLIDLTLPPDEFIAAERILNGYVIGLKYSSDAERDIPLTFQTI